MSLPVPQIATQNYQQILNETLARIPVHNPEWTNFNDSDPGVTLLQLFAFLSESLQYRVNQIPERNRLKFLRLLGVPLQPAEAAQGLVTFSNDKGPLSVKVLAPDMQVLSGQVPFRTLDGIDVLPIKTRVYYKAAPDLDSEAFAATEAIYKELYASLQAPGGELAYYETKQLDVVTSGVALPVLDLSTEGQTVDGNVWLALLARKPADVDATRALIANRSLTLSIVPAVPDAERTLIAGGQIEEDAVSNMVYEVPMVVPGLMTEQATYRVLNARPSGNLLTEPGVVELQLPSEDELRTWGEDELGPLVAGTGAFPPSLEDTEDADRLITWLRIRVADAPEVAAAQISARLSYLGPNGSRVQQRARISSEFVGQGSGEPDQVFTLVNTPVIVDTVQLFVNGELWTQTDDLSAAPPEAPRRNLRTVAGTIESPVDLQASKVYTVDRQSGDIQFGNGLRGARPPRGAIIQATYDYGGGLQGMVGIGGISKGANLPSGVKVANPIPTWGGDEAETVDEAERRIPQFLKHRDRLVTAEDFEEITRRTPGVEIGRVEVLPLTHPDLPDVVFKGLVTLLLLPRFDAQNPTAPRPDRLFLDTVCAYLNPRRLITTEIHVRGPEYVPVYVSIGIEVLGGYDVVPVREAVKETIRLFMSPLYGGYEGAGWPLSQDVDARELLAVAARVTGVSKVTGTLLAEGDKDPSEIIPIRHLQLPNLLSVGVRLGDPQSLDELRGVAPADDVQALPVPIVPEEC